MISREQFEKFQSVLTSGSVDMQGVKAREWTGLPPDDHDEILANYSAYSEQFAQTEEVPEASPVEEPEEPEEEETEEEEAEPEEEPPEEEVEEG